MKDNDTISDNDNDIVDTSPPPLVRTKLAKASAALAMVTERKAMMSTN